MDSLEDKRGNLTKKQALVCMLGLCVYVAFVVADRAWISDDAFITLRYVKNTLAGYGPVFNVGERVQGFTHPLWFGLLLPLCAVFPDAILAVVGWGIVLTLATMMGWALLLLRLARSPRRAFECFLLGCLVLVSSDPWVSFQTGGLENPLSHLLLLALVAELYLKEGSRPAVLVLLSTLLCLNRPDFAVFCLPVGVFALLQVRGWSVGRNVALAALPGVVWLGFAGLYYGHPLPNTATAKLGIFPNQMEAALQGVLYLFDWSVQDTLAVVGAVVFVFALVRLQRDRVSMVLGASLALHFCYVLWVGGDFMRGRFFLPVLVVGVFAGSLTLAGARGWADAATRRQAFLWVCLFLIAVAAHDHWNVGRRDDWEKNRATHRVYNERKYYEKYALRHYLREGRVECSHLDLSLAEDLKKYVEVYGPVTVHFMTPGTIGYLTGPDVTMIDLLGLTDAYIARLPREYMALKIPRPGHAVKYVPLRYLAARGDISILPNWKERVRALDGTLREEVREYLDSERFFVRKGIVTVDLPVPPIPEGLQGSRLDTGIK